MMAQEIRFKLFIAGVLSISMAACSVQPAGGQPGKASGETTKKPLLSTLFQVQCPVEQCRVWVFDGFRVLPLTEQGSLGLFAMPLPNTQAGVVAIASAQGARPDVRYIEQFPLRPVVMRPVHISHDPRVGWLVGIVYRSISGPHRQGIAEIVPNEPFIINRGRARLSLVTDKYGLVIRQLSSGRYRVHVRQHYAVFDVLQQQPTILPIDLARTVSN